MKSRRTLNWKLLVLGFLLSGGGAEQVFATKAKSMLVSAEPWAEGRDCSSVYANSECARFAYTFRCGPATVTLQSACYVGEGVRWPDGRIKATPERCEFDDHLHFTVETPNNQLTFRALSKSAVDVSCVKSPRGKTWIAWYTACLGNAICEYYGFVDPETGKMPFIPRFDNTAQVQFLWGGLPDFGNWLWLPSPYEEPLVDSQ